MTIFSKPRPEYALAVILAMVSAVIWPESTLAQSQGIAATGNQDAFRPSPAGETPFPSTSQFDRAAVDPDFRLAPGDTLLINVLEDPTLDTEVLVRPDGLITMPLAGTVTAAGRTPEEVAAAIRRGLASEFVEPPTVSVSLRGLGAAPPELLTIYIIGQVNIPGRFAIEEPINILQALALAGGLGIFANDKKIQVRQVNEDGVERVLLFNYEAIEEGAISPKIMLDDGDMIVVPERGLFN